MNFHALTNEKSLVAGQKSGQAAVKQSAVSDQRYRNRLKVKTRRSAEQG